MEVEVGVAVEEVPLEEEEEEELEAYNQIEECTKPHPLTWCINISTFPLDLITKCIVSPSFTPWLSRVCSSFRIFPAKMRQT